MRLADIQENDVIVLLPRTLRRVRSRVLWVVRGVCSYQDASRRTWPVPGGTLTLFADHAEVRREQGDIFADFMVLPGHQVKDEKRHLGVRKLPCCAAHLLGIHTSICCRHQLDAEALRYAGM